MADTIRILVATDNHVGAHERDPVRNEDSWKTFDEILNLAREKEVDMVLLAGDLFHENKPSRISMYNVMSSLRRNCLGARPCELEFLGDGSEHFDPTFDHVNYEDPDINVSIPVFSIHGNHDDPSGEGHKAALDLLNMSGLVNYFGRTPQSDKIDVKPVLLQKGRTKLALYGLSNVRDERLYRTFRDEKVRFHKPGTQQSDWFNMICVHQNHSAHTETSYLPENFLPQFLDLVIWGHEHECDIEPHLNPEMNFRVMQPGSSIATSLVPGEAVPKHVTILSVTGRDFKSEPIRLRTVRPFAYRDVMLSQDKAAIKIGHKDSHRTELTRYLISIVESMIEEGTKQWEEAQSENPVSTQHSDEQEHEQNEPPLPLIRLRVDTMKPDGISKFEVENPQRFSNRFTGQVANTNDVIQFTTRKKAASGTRNKADLEAEKAIMERMQNLENIKVEKLVREFLEAQALTILPQNYFGDAVSQYVDKDDKHAMEMFVNDALANQIKTLVNMQNEGEVDEENGQGLLSQIVATREGLERDFAEGMTKARKARRRYKPRPDAWDSESDGPWEEQPGALIRSEEEDEDDDDEEEDGTPASRGGPGGRGRGRGARAGTTSTRGRGATRGKTATASTARSRKKAISEDEDESEEDVVMLDDDDDEEDSQAMFFSSNSKAKKTNDTAPSSRSKAAAPTSSRMSAAGKGKVAAVVSPIKKPPARAGASKSKGGSVKQGQLNFTTSQQSVLGRRAKTRSLSDDIEDEEGEDAFEPVSQAVSTRRKGRR